MASSSKNEIARELKKAIIADNERDLKRGLKDFSDKVEAYAKSISPVDGGYYIDSFTNKARNRRGKLPSRRISNVDPKAGIVEHGAPSEDRPQGGESPARHVFGRTAFEFGGTYDGGDEAVDEMGQVL